MKQFLIGLFTTALILLAAKEYRRYHSPITPPNVPRLRS